MSRTPEWAPDTREEPCAETPCRAVVASPACCPHAPHALDSRELTKKARAAGPGQLAYFLRQVDLALPEPERQRRAEHLRRAHFQRLALASAKARRKRSALTPTPRTAGAARTGDVGSDASAP